MARSESTYNIREAMKLAHERPNTLFGKQKDLALGRKHGQGKSTVRFLVARMLRRIGFN